MQINGKISCTITASQQNGQAWCKVCGASSTCSPWVLLEYMLFLWLIHWVPFSSADCSMYFIDHCPVLNAPSSSAGKIKSTWIHDGVWFDICFLSVLPVLFCTFIDSVRFNFFSVVQWIASGNCTVSLPSSAFNHTTIIGSSCLEKNDQVRERLQFWFYQIVDWSQLHQFIWHCLEYSPKILLSEIKMAWFSFSILMAEIMCHVVSCMLPVFLTRCLQPQTWIPYVQTKSSSIQWTSITDDPIWSVHCQAHESSTLETH